MNWYEYEHDTKEQKGVGLALLRVFNLPDERRPSYLQDGLFLTRGEALTWDDLMGRIFDNLSLDDDDNVVMLVDGLDLTKTHLGGVTDILQTIHMTDLMMRFVAEQESELQKNPLYGIKTVARKRPWKVEGNARDVYRTSIARYLFGPDGPYFGAFGTTW